MNLTPRDLPDLRLRILMHHDLASYFAVLRRNHSGGTSLSTDNHFVNTAINNLGNAPLHYVAEPFCELVRAAAPSIPMTTTVTAQDLPSPTGMAYFSLPFEWYAPGVRYPTTWLVLWCEVRGTKAARQRKGLPPEVDEPHAVMTWWLADRDAIEVAIPIVTEVARDKEFREKYARAPEVESQFAGMTDEDMKRAMRRIQTGPTMIPIMTAEMTYDAQLSSMDGIDEPGDPYWFFRYVFTLWNLQRQRVTREHYETAPRATQRRLAREGAPEELGRVRVIDLGGHNSAGDGTGRDYHHRWVVNGHWRNQWYPSIEDHRPIWISPYTKGPEDAPLLTGEKVYRWEKQ